MQRGTCVSVRLGMVEGGDAHAMSGLQKKTMVPIGLAADLMGWPVSNVPVSGLIAPNMMHGA